MSSSGTRSLSIRGSSNRRWMLQRLRPEEAALAEISLPASDDIIPRVPDGGAIADLGNRVEDLHMRSAAQMHSLRNRSWQRKP